MIKYKEDEIRSKTSGFEISKRSNLEAVSMVGDIVTNWYKEGIWWVKSSSRSMNVREAATYQERSANDLLYKC